MAIIKDEVLQMHLHDNPDESPIVQVFKNGFDINWARKRRAHNTVLSCYILGPERYMKETFGFEFEIALFITKFTTVEPRVIQAINQILFDDPYHGRVDNSIFIVVSLFPGIGEWISDYSRVSPIPRTAIGMYAGDVLKGAREDAWFLRNKLSDYLFGQDLFDNRLPLSNDLYFFGRLDKVHSLTEAIRRSENRGIFGLRKTGKTSLIFKVARHCQENDIAQTIYLDCKDPDIRNLHWAELLSDIAGRLAGAFELKSPPTSYKGSKALRNVCSRIPGGRRACVIFDEIEYISFLAKRDLHWTTEYVEFWQTLWSLQSTSRNISFVIAGVNPGVTEVDLVDGVQNPLFQIFTPVYLTGLELSELRSMVRFFGKRMGLGFSEEAVKYLHHEYGGHPLLTRMACSYCHLSPELPRNKRPLQLDVAFLERTRDERDSELVNYCGHVVSEIKIFYEFEYDVLEMMASGQTADVIELGANELDVRHITNYGLISKENGLPSISIPVLKRYIARDAARRRGSSVQRAIIPESTRVDWLRRRTSTILRDIRQLSEALAQRKQWSPFPEGHISEPEGLLLAGVVYDSASFRNFILSAYRSLAEKVDRNKLRQLLPTLSHATERIVVYRHNEGHLQLTEKYKNELLKYIEEDIGSSSAVKDKEFYFILQQTVLDELFSALQAELARLE